jgi:cell wall-associated NlpC family hydrolase
MFKKKIIAAIVMTATIATSLFATSGEKAEAEYYHTKAITVAKANLGVPYRWGGITPSGFDCSGLVKYSFGKAGVTLPRTASDMFYTKGYRVSSLQVGDLMFFAPTKASKPTHVAIYIGSGKMIMASSSKGVIITYTSNTYWKPRYVGAKRI